MVDDAGPALLTGRNHHRAGAGTITPLANDWDGYSGMWPATSASIAKVLGYYGYATSAFGKWHNTPPTERPLGPWGEPVLAGDVEASRR
jgi:arylsulfatase A-like enzyme